jgi:hypothetical protein
MSTSCLSVNNMQFNNNTTTKYIDSHSIQQPPVQKQSNKICVKKKKLNSKSPSPMSLEPLNYCTLTTTTTTTIIQQNNNDERDNLIEKLNKNHKTILCARNEYLKEYKNFIHIAYKFYDEKYLNLKLKFKNQILKQQIYFESELYDISKECQRDYDYHISKLRLECATNGTNHLYKKLKLNIKNIAENYLKLSKIDMKKLISYMKDALINSYDTLIEAYETCHVLKLIEKLLKQNNISHMQLMNQNKNSLGSIQQYLTDSDSEETMTSSADDDDDDDDEYIDEQMQIVKYKQEMDNLMNTLDDIEVQYLQRKDQMQKRSKLFYQLKSKIKYIENKYDCLSKNVNNLKYESCVYKNLFEEKFNDNLPVGSMDKLTPFPQQHDNEDYSRKLHLISNLINLHKTKNNYRARKQQQVNSFIKKRFNDNSTFLQLYECTCDGDLVTIENCNLKADHDVSEWIVTRQIDNMPLLSYKIPAGSVCKSGKVLCVKTMFNDQIDFLHAIKNIEAKNEASFCIRIHTKLISNDGKIISSHLQEIPQFYREIFKYANLIGFL